MGRKSKYTIDFKLSVVDRYLNKGEGSREFYSLQKHKPLFLKMSHIISISFSSGYLFAFFSPLS
jgi:hypothetical protein